MKTGSLFSGYSGLDLAVNNVLGSQTVWHSEIDKGACKVLAHRFPGVPNHGDITTVDWSQVEPVDILTGGFPCQDVSSAGKRAGIRPGTRSGLWAQFAYAIDQLRPRLVVIENVRGLLSAEAHSDVEPCPWCVGDDPDGALRALGAVLGDLADLGYDAQWHGLRAADVGAPHGRWRIFVVAYPASERRAGGEQSWAHMEQDGSQPAHAGSSGPALLPTPRSSDTNGAGEHGTGGVDLRTAVALLPTPAVNGPVARIIEERSEVDETTGCRVWTSWTNGAYGKFSVGNKKTFAHRAAYELRHGPIPDGYEIDHLCQDPLCVNADHLEAVTPEENRRRVTERRTHCKRGHEFTEENTYWVRPGARACRACRAWQDRVQKARRKGEEIPLLPTPVTNDMGEGKTPEAWGEWTAKMKAAHGNGNGHGASLAIEAQRLLPTPTVQDSLGVEPPDAADVTLTDAVVHTRQNFSGSGFGGNGMARVLLLSEVGPRRPDDQEAVRQWPARGQDGVPQADGLLPGVREHEGGRDRGRAALAGQEAQGGDLSRLWNHEASARSPRGPQPGEQRPGQPDDTLRELPSQVALAGGPRGIDWGPYTAAIRRWEGVLGRPAPSPTILSKKGNPQLCPEFVTWMMGLPAGWVTDVPGITRNEALKLCGNGVVPQQAEAALRILLSRMAVAA